MELGGLLALGEAGGYSPDLVIWKKSTDTSMRIDALLI